MWRPKLVPKTTLYTATSKQTSKQTNKQTNKTTLCDQSIQSVLRVESAPYLRYSACTLHASTLSAHFALATEIGLTVIQHTKCVGLVIFNVWFIF